MYTFSGHNETTLAHFKYTAGVVEKKIALLMLSMEPLGGPCHLNLIDKANLKDDKSLIGAENEVSLEASNMRDLPIYSVAYQIDGKVSR